VQAGTGVAKIGPCGGNGGRPHDVKVAPHRLKSVTICSGTVVNSLSFSYSDHTGKHHTAGPWGGHGGSNHTVSQNPVIYIVKTTKHAQTKHIVPWLSVDLCASHHLHYFSY